jgi:homoserine kinase
VLVAAFASGREDLIADAMRDRLHQPYRSEVCPLLPKLLPLSDTEGILGVALSGAGPAVLILINSEERGKVVEARVRKILQGCEPVEILNCGLESQCAQMLGD